MERTDIIKSVYDLKCEVLKEIRKVLPKGIHYFAEPFFIHYIEGEVATTEICKAVEVEDSECQMVKIHQQSEGYGADDIDITDGEAIMQYEPQSFADILGNLKTDIRRNKISILRKLVKDAGGELILDGSFTFTGVNEMANSETVYVDDNKLFGITLMEDGTLLFDDMWEGDPYNNDEDYIDFDELDKIIEYIKSEIKRTYHIQVVASRFVDVGAVNRDEAVKLAKEEIKKHPLNEKDIDVCLIK